MKALPSFSLALFLCFKIGVASTHAQSYAPDIEFHDVIQRTFVVELARVLAWRENQKTNLISEVTYQVSTRTNGDTAWKIDWLDATGKPLKSSKVEYSADALKSGVEFYRQVFKQLWTNKWSDLKPLKPADVESEFWKGASEAEPSREASLIRALELQSTNLLKEVDATSPRISGLLVHATLPGTVSWRVSLDGVLSARAAAWLALAEQACSNQMTRPWSPILFAAGRERAAADIWRKGSASEQTASSVVAAWDLWLRHPKTKETYFFVVDSPCRSLGMDMLVYDAKANNTSSLLTEAIKPIVGTKKQMMELHNYGPVFARRTGIGGGHIFGGAFPIFQRSAWLDLLAHYPKNADEVDFTKELISATNALAKELEFDSDLDACLYGFKEVVPLLKLGFTEGIGKLRPTAVATDRDLLNYGWESTGLQMGSRHQFIKSRWGVPERAKPIADTVTREVPGLRPFFYNKETFAA